MAVNSKQQATNPVILNPMSSFLTWWCLRWTGSTWCSSCECIRKLWRFQSWFSPPKTWPKRIDKDSRVMSRQSPRSMVRAKRTYFGSLRGLSRGNLENKSEFVSRVFRPVRLRDWFRFFTIFNQIGEEEKWQARRYWSSRTGAGTKCKQTDSLPEADCVKYFSH